ncbi:complement factor I-like [Thrips palmi]|uniref:Complement factor I-like n=1 Tax=Thrips palmi TaxID=161013 RepID=A0A6P8ZD99_THRPL|nr:complement factor I-like [Thrips palmi]
MPSVRVVAAAVAVLILVVPLCGALRSSASCQQQGKFSCPNGKCISGSLWCNGINDCGDNADETSCRVCMSGSVKCKSSNQCVPSGARCNGVEECLDKSDELGCEVVVTEQSTEPIQTAVQAHEVRGSQITSGSSRPALSIFFLTVFVAALIR